MQRADEDGQEVVAKEAGTDIDQVRTDVPNVEKIKPEVGEGTLAAGGNGTLAAPLSQLIQIFLITVVVRLWAL